jgi:hypothetical protein
LTVINTSSFLTHTHTYMYIYIYIYISHVKAYNSSIL